MASGLRYGDVSPYTSVLPGSYAVSVRAAGSPRSTPPELTARIDMPAGAARTVAISGLFAGLGVQTLSDDLGPTPDRAARVRVVAAASRAPSVSLRLDGRPAPATALPFGAAGGPVDVAAGPTTATVDGAAPLPLTLAGGSISTLLVLDAPGGGLAVRVVQDAAGPAVAPTGAVQAGGGGTAGVPGTLWVAAAAAVLALASRRGRMLTTAAALALAGATAVPASPLAAPASPAAARPAQRTTTVAPAADAVAPVPPPVRLTVPAAGIDTGLTGIDLDATGALTPPSTDTVAGWYRAGPSPGAPGPAVVTGHVDSAAGPAVFFRLRDVRVGDPVSVVRADGTTVRFTVTRVARYPKAAFPAAEVYAPRPGPELRLITCGGTFDHTARSYLDDLVVYAN